MNYGTASQEYQVVSYASSSGSTSSYSSIKTTWQKRTCCGAFRFGSPCTDCPGGGY